MKTMMIVFLSAGLLMGAGPQIRVRTGGSRVRTGGSRVPKVSSPKSGGRVSGKIKANVRAPKAKMLRAPKSFQKGAF